MSIQAVASPRSAQIKISCRNLWKIYAQGSGAKAPGAGSDVAATVERLRADGSVVAVADVSFDVGEGEVFVIMGLSGSGKSTTLRCIARLIEPTSGSILLDGVDLLKASRRELVEIRRHRLGMVFQSFGLMPYLTVLENIAFPLKVQGIDERRRYARAMEMIELVGLQGRESAYPAQLSGGQQQRVGIARSLAVNPEVWLLDEPFSALDPLIRRQMQDEFLRLQRQLRKTIIFITHDILEALRIADRIAIMRGGRIEQLGTPAEIVVSPQNAYVAGFTRDVPVSRVVRVSQVMEEARPQRANGRSVRAETILADALPHFLETQAPLPVVDHNGLVIGQVTSAAILRALAGRWDEAKPLQ